MQPIAAELDQRAIKTLVFVLDGALRNVPMAAMHDGQQYLIERYGIAIAPSCNC
jgi:CHAT domain-containing protein